MWFKLSSRMEKNGLGTDTKDDMDDPTLNIDLYQPKRSEAESLSALKSTCEMQNSFMCPDTVQPCDRLQGPPSQNEQSSMVDTRSRNKSTYDNDSDTMPTSPRRRQFKTVWIPYLAVLLPTLVLPATLIGLVFVHRVDPGKNLFPMSSETTTQTRGYYLVAFSITRLAIISSCASTLAPFLTAPILILWRVHTIRTAKQGSNQQVCGSLELADIPRFGTLLGLLAGAPDELLRYLFRSSVNLLPARARALPGSHSMSRPVHLAALVAASCILITISLWTADTVFHTLSNSVNIVKFDASSSSLSSFGYATTQRCQNFDRSNNDCLPCTWDLGDDLPWLEFTTRANEIFRLGANVSDTSQIQAVTPDLSILFPRPARVSNRTDYRARTIGVSVTCQPVTETCKMRSLDVHTYTMFNCSKDFRGVLGQSPVVPTTQNFTILDPDTPPLNFKPSAYTQYGFYQDSELSIPYNSVGWNVTVPSWATLFGDASTAACPSDDALPATAFMGVAGRFSVTSAKAGVNQSTDAGLHSTAIYSDFAFRCTLDAHEVEYVWASEAVRNYTIKPADVSLLNMYIGQLPYYKQAATNDMTNDILQMALQPDSQSMADTWANLFSVRVLSVIGGYTQASTNIEQQNRVEVLVAQVHIGSMWFLVGCSLGTAAFVSWMTFRGLHIVSQDPEIPAEAAVLSYNGQIKQMLKEKKVMLSVRTAGMDTKVDAVDSLTDAVPAPPERSFTDCSTATTVVPDTEVV